MSDTIDTLYSHLKAGEVYLINKGTSLEGKVKLVKRGKVLGRVKCCENGVEWDTTLGRLSKN